MGDADGYRLAPVRDVRARDERVKQGDLAGAAADARATEAKLAAASARVAAIRAAIDTARARLRDRIAAGDGVRSANASELVLAEHHLARLRRDLEAALDACVRAEAAHRGQLAAVDTARARLARARADKEVVERHFAAWRAERRKLADRRED